MYSTRPEDKLVLVLDDEEVLNYQNFLEHLPTLVNMAKLAAMPNKPAQYAAQLAKYEEFYGLKASSIAIPNVPLVDAAFQALKRLMAQGRIANVVDPSRFKYPSQRSDIDAELKEAFQFASKSGQDEPETMPSTTSPTSPKLSFNILEDDTAEEQRLREAREADAERRRREQQIKQEKAAQKKEEEAQRLKAILEQAEKVKVERARIEEEAKINRAVEAAQAAQQLEASSGNPNTSNGLQLPSASPISSTPSSPKATSPRKPTYASVVGAPQTGTQQSESSYRSGGHWAVPTNSSSTPSHVSAASSSSSIFKPSNTGSTKDFTGSSMAADTTPTLASDGLAYYVQLLRKLESELVQANNMIKTLSLLRQSNPRSTEVEAAVTKWTHFADALRSDIVTVSDVIRQGVSGVGQNIRSSSIPQPVSTGFTLGSLASDVDLDESPIAGVALVMESGVPVWRVRVQMPNAAAIVVNINPAHTVADLMGHLATLQSITSRFKLEIVGKPGALEHHLTAEQAGLKNTTLRLSSK